MTGVGAAGHPRGVAFRRGPAGAGLTLAWRGLLKIRHSPDQLLDLTLMPISFVVLFTFLFGTAVAGDWHTYLQYVLPGVAVQTAVFASMNSAIAVNSDVRTGVFDRLRSLPIARSAPLVGRVLSDLVRNALSLTVVFIVGAILGFRTHGEAGDVALACLLVLLFSMAMGWVSVLIGLLARSPESIGGFGFVLILPLTFGSNVFVPAAKLPGWLQVWVRVNPVTRLSDAARGLMLGTPTGNAVLVSLLWTAAIVAVFAPLAVLAYRRRS
ncbi:ABC transporter permease [Sphaerisporangium corydalis]|uniref:Transport permease protein n=1 Tax=Sphaerisporangium corydalis TaxID=1441875 RepID=A0ABV9E7L6_9ACTN|nr:ABC transporter permease [Sphaerisporangium corydalis]